MASGMRKARVADEFGKVCLLFESKSTGECGKTSQEGVRMKRELSRVAR